MNCVYVTTIGPVDPAIVVSIEAALRGTAGVETGRLPALPEPAYAWDPARRQFSSSLILNSLVGSCPSAAKVLGVTERDLFIPMLSFIYGQAQVGGSAALLSLARLRQEFYGLPASETVLFERARKEALHEVGHTFGLIHCPDKTCAMTLSTSIRQVDLKTAGYCAGCAALLGDGNRRLSLEGSLDESPLANSGC